jgi:putative ABC transport system substrate-binding protein
VKAVKGQPVAILLVLSATVFALCFSAEAQRPKKVPRIGYVSSTKTIIDPREEAFRQALRDLGYIQGKNILFENRYIEGNMDRVPSSVAELVQLKVDVLVLVQIESIRTAKEATKTIPIVMMTTQDPVATGLIDSLARRAEISLITRLTRELSGKRLVLLKDAVSGLPRVAVLRHANDEGGFLGFREYETPARALKIQLQSLEVPGSTPDMESAFDLFFY